MITKIGAVAVVMAATLLGACDPVFKCEDQVKRRVPSPDRRYEAIYSIRACGATTPDAAWVRVVPVGEDPSKAEPVATFQGELPKAPFWEGNTLIVEYGSAKPFKQQSTSGEVHIRYAPGNGQAE